MNLYEYKKQWSKEHIEAVRTSKKRWKLRNPDKVAAGNSSVAAQASKKRWRNRNKAKSQAYYVKNKVRILKTLNAARLKREYGITQSEVDALFEAQKGLCPICEGILNPPPDRTTHIDHDHVSHKVRGLLHNRCNMALGLLSESPEVLRKAADYLEKHGASGKIL